MNTLKMLHDLCCFQIPFPLKTEQKGEEIKVEFRPAKTILCPVCLQTSSQSALPGSISALFASQAAPISLLSYPLVR